MYLPFALWRGVSPRKVESFLLDESHPDGGAKASYFKSFGFVSANADVLMTALFDHPVRNAVSEVKKTLYGEKYIVRGLIETPDGRNPSIVSIWVVEADQRPRLLTAYPD